MRRWFESYSTSRVRRCRTTDCMCVPHAYTTVIDRDPSLMSRVFAASAVVFLVTACGGSSHKTSSNAPAASPGSTTQTAPTSTPATQTSQGTTPHTVTTGATNVRLPATFTIGAG